jgi:hypothetical protein
MCRLGSIVDLVHPDFPDSMKLLAFFSLLADLIVLCCAQEI